MSEVGAHRGLERHALAVDWFVDEAPSPIRSVTIAATARQHLEARMECAASAGISLSAIDGEPHAALRAMRYAASHELDPHEPYVALWIGTDGVYGWRIVDDSIACEMRYPAPEHADLADALRDLAHGPDLDCALLSGEVDLLDGVGFSAGGYRGRVGLHGAAVRVRGAGRPRAAAERCAVARAGGRGCVRACVARGDRMMRGLL